MVRLSIFVVFASYFAVSLALRCWKCEYQSAEDCLKYGKIEKCSGGDQGTCQTEVRPNNGKALVRTGCKQRNACSNNYNQNTRKAWSPTQCNKKGVSSICRCCCFDDVCNKKMAKNLCEQEIQTPTKKPEKCLAPPEAPINGGRKCARDLQPGARCQFTCNKGYQLNGHVTTNCVKNENGNGFGWDKETPTCEPEDICPIPPETPKNAQKVCKGNRKVNSYCDFSCDYGYVMHGQSRVTCKPTMSSGLKWIPQTPTCELPICEPLPTKPINGDFECNGEGELGTKCEFTCNTGYYMIGRENTVCERTLLSTNGADWSNPTPICKKVQCAFLPKTPRNGYKECSSGRDLGSVCDFACFEGYKLAGYSATTCRRDDNDKSKADWDREVPTCEPLPVCDALPNKPTNGDRTCTGRGKIGARCDFTCNNGYVLIGHDHTICEKTSSAPTGTWNNPTPTCIEVRCDFLPQTPQNGYKECSSGRDLGSVCSFACIQGYTLTGYRSTTCRQDKNDMTKADWDREEPTCKPPVPVCPDIGNLKHGEIDCTKPYLIGTLCEFQCNTSYTLIPKDRTEAVCQKNKTWSPKPCCVDCSQIKRDVIIALDVSGSIKDSDFQRMKKFLRDIISKFSYGDESSLFIIFQFGYGVEDLNGLNEFNLGISKTDLLDRVDSMTRIRELKKKPLTETGKALRHAQNAFKNGKMGNREGFRELLFIFTDGEVASSDRQNMIDAAEEMRDEEVDIMVLGIGMDEDFKQDMAKNVTGSEGNVFIKKNVSKLTDAVADKLFSKTCEVEMECKEQ